ncbi:MAG: M20/M25/M40 family metallo-hydrolase [Rhodothermales bacterium]|nr:M20/M25/M40 family metallo-hydrolase [Rhodothermales bacterium]
MRRAFFLALLLMPALTQAQPHEAVEAARQYRTAHAAEILADYAALLALPNVASDSAGIHRNAAYLRDAFRERGVTMEVLTLPGVPPLVYGEIVTPGATRTLGIYVHYDGQPVDPSRWTHGPWEPTLYTASMEQGGTPRPFPAAGEPVDPAWYLYARSAGDDKAPLGALLATLDALRAHGIALTSNIKFLFDGEEEAGSAHLGDYLARYGDRYADVDFWLFCDGPVHQSRRPQLVFGVRGVTGLEVTVYGATRSLHSGHYGNWAPVPGMMLAHLLASMKSEDGEVLIDGFYDTVAPIGEAERTALAALPAYDDALRQELGLARTEGGGAALAERLLLPSLTVKGLESGNVGAKARNVIPATATAALGVRLVKGNDPEHMLDLVEAHIRRQGYHIVREDPDAETRRAHPRLAKVRRGGGYPAARTSMDHPLARQVAEAMARAAGEAPILVPALGGSHPLYHFTDVLGTPAVIVPIANHDNNQHAPDENLRLANLFYGIDLYAALLTMP